MGDLLTIYADGACRRNPGPGGWAWIRLEPSGIVESCGFEPHTTNNRMEILAVIEGLAAIPAGSTVLVISDSRYVIDGASAWMFKWARLGWRRKVKKVLVPVKNPDLWQRLHALVSERSVTWQWVKGHAGNVHNERCDELAEAAAGSQE